MIEDVANPFMANSYNSFNNAVLGNNFLRRPMNKQKKDSLWKPLIRMFRRYLKKDALPTKTYYEVRTQPLNQQGYLFGKALNLPEEMAQDENTNTALMLMINSHRITRNRQMKSECT